jgi:hypothetical protein
LKILTVDVGTTNTTCVNGNVDIILLECLELEFFLVEGLPPVTHVNKCAGLREEVTYFLGSLTTNPVAVSG